MNEELPADGERGGSASTDRTELTTSRSADLTKSFRPSTTDQFVVSNWLLAFYDIHTHNFDIVSHS